MSGNTHVIGTWFDSFCTNMNMSYDMYLWTFLWIAEVITANILSFWLGCFNTWMTFGVFAISKVSDVNKAISQNYIYKQKRNIQHKDYLVYCLVIGTFRCTLCKATALTFIPLSHWTKKHKYPHLAFIFSGKVDSGYSVHQIADRQIWRNATPG